MQWEHMQRRARAAADAALGTRQAVHALGYVLSFLHAGEDDVELQDQRRFLLVSCGVIGCWYVGWSLTASSE